jgi:hypothetical protein
VGKPRGNIARIIETKRGKENMFQNLRVGKHFCILHGQKGFMEDTKYLGKRLEIKYTSAKMFHSLARQ